MICRPCLEGDHKSCDCEECECSRLEAQIEREIAQENSREAAMAEAVYSNLLSGGSKVVVMMTEGSGKPAVRLFISQVLSAARALKC